MAGQAPLRLFVGRYTAGDPSGRPGPGITLAIFDPVDAVITPVGAWSAPDASFLAVDRGGDVLYAVRDDPHGRVTAYSLGADGGHIRELGTCATGGARPCHLAVDPTGRFLLTANFGSGSVAVHPVRGDGGLGERSDLAAHYGSGPETAHQPGPRVHMVAPDPAGRTVLTVDLGADTVCAYTLDRLAGRLTPLARNRMRPGSGPRHLAFHPSGGHLFLANELGDTLSVCTYDPVTGVVKALKEYPTAPAGAHERNYPGGVVVSPDGRHVYVSNRGDDSIAGFAVLDDGALIEPIGRWDCGGSWPRHLTLSPDGHTLFCANQRAGGVTVFRVDVDGGALEPTGTALAVDRPAQVLVG